MAQRVARRGVPVSRQTAASTHASAQHLRRGLGTQDQTATAAVNNSLPSALAFHSRRRARRNGQLFRGSCRSTSLEIEYQGLDSTVQLRRYGAADQYAGTLRQWRGRGGVMHVAADQARFAGAARAATAAEVGAQTAAFRQLQQAATARCPARLFRRRGEIDRHRGAGGE